MNRPELQGYAISSRAPHSRPIAETPRSAALFPETAHAFRSPFDVARDDRVDVFQADGNSLDLERSALITGGDDITDILIADFDDNPDPELAVLDSGYDQVRIYDLQDGFATATLLFTLDVTDGAAALLGLPTW